MARKSESEVLALIPEDLRRIDGARVDSVVTINHKPHMFMIGPRHIHEAQHHCGVIGREVIEAVPCAAPKCGQPHTAHTYDTVAVIALERPLTEAVVRAWLVQIADAKVEGLDGFVFLETGHRVIHEEQP